MEQDKLKSVIESILFVSGEPVKISRIAKISQASEDEIEAAITSLASDFSQKRGVVILRREDMIQMATAPENSFAAEKLVKSEIQENLSRAALEVLAIVAYRGPISRVNVEAIRGVNCSSTLRSLMMRGLLERIDNPQDSRSYLYKISFDFLQKLGLEKVENLPDFETLSRDLRIDSVISPA